MVKSLNSGRPPCQEVVLMSLQYVLLTKGAVGRGRRLATRRSLARIRWPEHLPAGRLLARRSLARRSPARRVAGPPVAGPPVAAESLARRSLARRSLARRLVGTAVGGTTSLPWRLPAGRLLWPDVAAHRVTAPAASQSRPRCTGSPPRRTNHDPVDLCAPPTAREMIKHRWHNHWPLSRKSAGCSPAIPNGCRRCATAHRH